MSKKLITNIVGDTSKYDTAKLSLAETINMYVETISANESSSTKILKSIKGTEVFQHIDGVCRGMYTISNGLDNEPQVYVVYGPKVYLLYNNTYYEVAEISNQTTPVRFAETLGDQITHSHLLFVDGIGCYSIDTGGTPLQQKESFHSIELPFRRFKDNHKIRIQPTHIAYAYGYIIINDSNNNLFYTSYQYPFLTRIGNDEYDYDLFKIHTDEYKDYGHYTFAEYSPDNIIALCSNGSRVFTFGQNSYQVFQYTNDINNPFSSPDTAAQRIGIKSSNSLAQLGPFTCFLGGAEIGNNGIYLNINGSTECQRISNYAIEQTISKLPMLDKVYAFMYQYESHVFYVITIDPNTTFCYDIKEQSWTTRCSLNMNNERKCWRYKYATMNKDGKVLFGTDNIVAIESKHYVDIELPLLRLRAGGIVSADNLHFYLNNVELQMNNGQFDNLNPDKEALISMRFSADGASYSDYEVVSIGKQGEYDYDAIWYNFGLCKFLTLEFSTTDDIPFSIYGLNMNYDTCQW